MNRNPGSSGPNRKALALAIVASLLGLSEVSTAQPDQAEPPAMNASAPADHKDIVVDVPAATNSAIAASSRPDPSKPSAPTATISTGTVQALNELALELLRAQSQRQGHSRNQAVSPVSLMSAMGMVHAGTGGAGAREIAGLMGATSANSKAFTVRWPQAYRAVAEAGQQTGQLGMISRLWVDKGLAASLTPAFVSQAKQRYAAEGSLLDFAQSDPARDSINAWASKATNAVIPELLPPGSIKPNTKVVVTNAVHFKAPWEQPFDASATQPAPFALDTGGSKAVPTMSGLRTLRAGLIDNITVYELPFAGQGFVLRLAMPPKGHTLQAMLADQDGSDLAAWGAELKPTTCRFSLPRFKLAAATQALKPTLQGLGVQTIFEQSADFSPMLGRAGKGLQVDNVFQSVMVTIDEAGGEAAAASAVTVQAKSFSPLAQVCSIDRPFLFAIVHQASQVPVFVGQVTDPSQP